MKHEELVYDLNYLKPNFEITTKWIVVKIGKYYHTFGAEDGRYGETCEFLSGYDPLPHATPQPKRVKLKNADGEEIWIDFKPTHKSDMGGRCMYFSNTSHQKKVAVFEDCLVLQNYDMSSCKPIQHDAPAKRITDQIDKVIDSANLDCVKEELRKLKDVVREVL